MKSAKLRLFASSGTANGPAAYRTANTWSERAITWRNRPAATGGPMSDKGSTSANTRVELDLTPVVTVGTYSFRLATTSNDGVSFHSREGTARPELVLTLE